MESSTETTTSQTLITTLLGKLSVLELKVSDLEAENLALRSENMELRARLGLDSSNSSKPPSSDGYKKKPLDTSALKKVGGKKVGGQPQHKGHHLEMQAVPDTIEIHHAPHCTCCGNTFSVSDTFYLGIAQKRQVFDMPTPTLFVTEHQTAVHFCCGRRHVGLFPSGVSAPVQYGVNIETLCNILTNDCRLSYEKASELLSDIYGCSLNVSTIYSANETLYENLAPIEESIKAEILQSEVVHFDETGMRVEGKLHWFHVACNALWVYILVAPKRGLEALKGASSILPSFKGWAVHDCWASYFSFDNCTHALCNAHILRELQALIDSGSIWARLMHKFLLNLYKQSEEGTQTVPNPSQAIQTYQYICNIANKEEPAPIAPKRGKPKNTKGRNLLNRLITHQEAVLAFALHQNVPFTNNCAEQAIRHVKVKQKVSMCFRKLKGAQMYARIQGTIATIRKHKMNVFKTLKDINLKNKIIFTNP